MDEPNAQQRTNSIANEIFGGMFPHDEGLSRYTWKREPIPEYLRLPRITPEHTIRVGELIAYQNMCDEREWARLTAREYVNRWGLLDYAVVEKATAKTLTVRLLPHPVETWRSDISNWIHRDTGPTERLLRGTRTRTLFLIGNANEVQAKINGHPRFADWQAARAAAEELEAAAEHDRQAARKRTLAGIRPYKEAAAVLNTAVDAKAVQIHEGNYQRAIEFKTGWEVLAHLDRGTVYLNGLAALGRLTEQDLPGAVEALLVLNAVKGLTVGQLITRPGGDTP